MTKLWLFELKSKPPITPKKAYKLVIAFGFKKLDCKKKKLGLQIILYRLKI